MESRGMDITMEFFCTLAVVNPQGGIMKDFSRGSITVTSMSRNSTCSTEPIIILRTSLDCFTAKYKLIGNVEHLSTEYSDVDGVLVFLKEPSCYIFISNADPNELTEFITYLKAFLPKYSPPHDSLEPPIPEIFLNFDGHEEYKERMKNIIDMNVNLDLVSYLRISDCSLELAGDQLPIAGAIRKMKNLTTLRLISIDLCSSTFLEIESKELQRLHLFQCKTELPTASLFKNDLRYKDSLVELRLSGNGWSEIPNGIFQFRNLLKLSLYNNCITKLPDKFANFPKLQELELSCNQLTHVPPSIFQMRNLLRLSLSINHITELPDIINLPKLEELELSYNQLRSVPASIFQLQNLSELDLSDNYITELPDIINLPKLECLSLEKNQLQYLPPSIFSLHLKEFDIDYELNYEIPPTLVNYEVPPSVGSELIVHSLKELSYRTILKHKLKVEEGMLPKRFLKDLANHRQCICGCKFVEGQEVSFLCNFNDISRSSDDFLILFKPKIPIRGTICNSWQSCFHGRLPRVN